MMRAVKAVRVLGLAGALLVAAAGPAGATPVLADQKYQWFYWLAPILVISVIGMILFLSGGYITKVLLPKYRGRKVKE